eukprot:218529-Hanusia_phi.AAC.1
MIPGPIVQVQRFNGLPVCIYHSMPVGPGSPIMGPAEVQSAPSVCRPHCSIARGIRAMPPAGRSDHRTTDPIGSDRTESPRGSPGHPGAAARSSPRPLPAASEPEPGFKFKSAAPRRRGPVSGMAAARAGPTIRGFKAPAAPRSHTVAGPGPGPPGPRRLPARSPARRAARITVT